ncbi:hypothetical protein SNL152K_2422 [Streptomyces sp. NL15-2K]|nr:hypothetical protein SNL152K_2422 [Streptomyces sp. NL15-2K]
MLRLNLALRIGQSSAQSARADTAVVPTPTGHDGRLIVCG